LWIAILNVADISIVFDGGLDDSHSSSINQFAICDKKDDRSYDDASTDAG